MNHILLLRLAIRFFHKFLQFFSWQWLVYLSALCCKGFFCPRTRKFSKPWYRNLSFFFHCCFLLLCVVSEIIYHHRFVVLFSFIYHCILLRYIIKSQEPFPGIKRFPSQGQKIFQSLAQKLKETLDMELCFQKICRQQVLICGNHVRSCKNRINFKCVVVFFCKLDCLFVCLMNNFSDVAEGFFIFSCQIFKLHGG